MEPSELSTPRMISSPTEPMAVGPSVRERLAQSLEAVLVSGLELVRKAVAGPELGLQGSSADSSSDLARPFDAENPTRIHAAIARWYEGSFRLIEAARRSSKPTEIDSIEAGLGIGPGQAVSILADELFHALHPVAVPIPQVDPALEPTTVLRWYCLCAVGSLDSELAIRGLQPVLRAVVLESWPGLIVQSMRLVAGEPMRSTRRPDPISPANAPVVRLQEGSGEQGEPAREVITEAASSADPLMLLTKTGSLDLVFDRVRHSGPLPVALEPLLMRLRIPFSALASLDPGFLRDEQRSLQRLLEALCDAARLAPEQLASPSPLMKQFEVAVRAVEVMAQQAQTRARVLNHQLERELRRAAVGVSTVLSRLERERDHLKRTMGGRNRRDLRRRPSREREVQVTDVVRGLLRRKIENRPLPDTVTDFLQQVWVRHLRTAVLRDGERSPQFHRALGVVDDLVWTLDATRKDATRTQLIQRIPGIVETFSLGARSVGLSDGEIQPFMDDLFIAHLRRMQRSSSRSAPDRTGNAATVLGGEQGMRVQARTQSAVLPDPAGSTQAIPLVRLLREVAVDDCPQNARAVPAAEADLDRIQPGCWLQMQSGDQFSRMKVAWMNGDRSVVLLVREGDRKAMSLRGRDLHERLIRQSAMFLV